MTGFWIFAIAALFVGYSLVSKRLSTTVISGPMIFVVVGAFLSTTGIGVLDTESTDATVTILLEATLAIVLFSDAAVINSTHWRREAFIPVRLLVIALPLMVVIGLFSASAIFPDTSLWEAGLIAALLAPTDAALGQAVISNPLVPRRVRQGLATESGLNDGIALMAVIIFLAGAESQLAGGTAAELLEFLGTEVVLAAVIGVGIGWLGGKALVWCSDRDWVAPTWLQIGAFALGIAAFGLALPLNASGFIAAWLAGLVLGTTTRDRLDDVNSFSENVGAGLTMFSFIAFGAVLLTPAFDFFSWRILLYAVLSLTVFRLVAVGISMIGSRLSIQTVSFLGWFGPRGLATIVLAGAVQDSGLNSKSLVVSVAMITVGLSVFAHGATAYEGSKQYGRWIKRNHPHVLADEDDLNPGDVPFRFTSPGVHEAVRRAEANSDEPD